MLASAASAWLLATPFAYAQVASIDAEEQTNIDELKAAEDPTILMRRIWLDTEWNSLKDSSDDFDPTVGGLWAWPVSANRDWAVRLKLPMRFHVAGNAPGDSNKQGLGDIKLATGTAIRFSESLRAGGGLEVRFPTATDDDLGANALRPQLFASAAWDVTRWITLSPSAEYNKSITEEHGTAPQHFLEVYFPVTFVLSPNWAVTPRFEVKKDFANDNRLTRSAKFQVATRLEDLPLGFSLSLKKQLNEGEKEFQINFITTYYFR